MVNKWISVGCQCKVETEFREVVGVLQRSLSGCLGEGRFSPLSVTGSGSGASFFSFQPADSQTDHPTVVVKTASLASPKARVEEEIDAYRVLSKIPHVFPYIVPLALSDEGAPDAFLVLPYICGEKTSTILRTPSGKHQYGDIFKRGIGTLLDYYLQQEQTVDTPLEWFFSKTIALALDPIQMYRQKSQYDWLRMPEILVNGILFKNGISVFESLQERQGTQNAVHIKQCLLSPRYVAEVPTDPNLLNEMVSSAGEVYWIDPGRVEQAQLSYPLIKHEGPFAHMLPYVLQGELFCNVYEGRY